MTRKWAPQTRYTLRSKTASIFSIMKDLISYALKLERAFYEIDILNGNHFSGPKQLHLNNYTYPNHNIPFEHLGLLFSTCDEGLQDCSLCRLKKYKIIIIIVRPSNLGHVKNFNRMSLMHILGI